MTTADWAFVISIFSAFLSLAGFIWNIWSKFIYPKPKVHVTFGFMTVVQAGSADEHVLSLSATNMGPAPVTLYSAIVRGSGWWFGRPKRFAMLNPLHNYPSQLDLTIGPFGGGLPKKIDVGEQFTAHFVPDHEGLARVGFDQIGFSDTFNRLHWAPRASLTKARKSIRDECDKSGKDYSQPHT